MNRKLLAASLVMGLVTGLRPPQGPRRAQAALATARFGSQAGSMLAQEPPAGARLPESPTRQNRSGDGASYGGQARRSLVRPQTLNEKAPAVCRVKFTTSRGDFVVEVTRQWAPLGADRFYNLVKNGFYDGASFFRVLPGFVVQFGISPDPQIARAWSRATLRDDPVLRSNNPGTLSFATAGKDSRTTQVFINLADNTALDRMGFSPFGKVIEGMEVVEKLYSGYGEGAPQGSGPDQGRLQAEGKAYLEKSFPKLDSVRKAVLLPDG